MPEQNCIREEESQTKYQSVTMSVTSEVNWFLKYTNVYSISMEIPCGIKIISNANKW